MIQRPAAGALDLEFGVVIDAGQQLLALPASIVFQHLQWSPCASPNEKPRRGGVWRGSQFTGWRCWKARIRRLP
ncbi:hypothetical protein ALO54_101448 [Pseudomonas syringae pv. philadelphi]|nr:hypothetical protein ALO54_101448 [Pseudomonas syringae pv. philadelphi]RMM24800.1 hypothetical protein ALQ83_101497 [Pseudomonas syringae pv. berberidis]